MNSSWYLSNGKTLAAEKQYGVLIRPKELWAVLLRIHSVFFASIFNTFGLLTSQSKSHSSLWSLSSWHRSLHHIDEVKRDASSVKNENEPFSSILVAFSNRFLLSEQIVDVFFKCELVINANKTLRYRI